jgi:hypothetical protein
MFIPKSGKVSYNKDQAYCPISLSSFLLKMREKLADRHLRDGSLKRFPLHQTNKLTKVVNLLILRFIM